MLSAVAESNCNMSLRLYGRDSRYGRRSTGRSGKDSRKEFEGVSEGVRSEQPINRRICIRRRVKLLGKGKLEFISDFSTCLYFDSTIYSDSPPPAHRYSYVSLTLPYCDRSCCPLTVLTVTRTGHQLRNAYRNWPCSSLAGTQFPSFHIPGQFSPISPFFPLFELVGRSVGRKVQRVLCLSVIIPSGTAVGYCQ